MPQEHLKGQLYPTNEYWILWPILCPKNGLQGAKWSQERFQGPKLTAKGLTRACLRIELVYMVAHSIHFVSCLKELGYTPWNKTSSQQLHTEQKQQLGRISPDIHSHNSIDICRRWASHSQVKHSRSSVYVASFPRPDPPKVDRSGLLLSSTPKARQYPTHIIILDNCTAKIARHEGKITLEF